MLHSMFFLNVILSRSWSPSILCVSSAGQGVIVQTIMPVVLEVGQEVCVWASLVGSVGMNMPLHQISVIPRDVTSSRVSGSGKAKDKDKQVYEELKTKSSRKLLRMGMRLTIMDWFECVVGFLLP